MWSILTLQVSLSPSDASYLVSLLLCYRKILWLFQEQHIAIDVLDIDPESFVSSAPPAPTDLLRQLQMRQQMVQHELTTRYGVVTLDEKSTDFSSFNIVTLTTTTTTTNPSAEDQTQDDQYKYILDDDVDDDNHVSTETHSSDQSRDSQLVDSTVFGNLKSRFMVACETLEPLLVPTNEGESSVIEDAGLSFELRGKYDGAQERVLATTLSATLTDRWARLNECLAQVCRSTTQTGAQLLILRRLRDLASCIRESEQWLWHTVEGLGEIEQYVDSMVMQRQMEMQEQEAHRLAAAAAAEGVVAYPTCNLTHELTFDSELRKIDHVGPTFWLLWLVGLSGILNSHCH